MLEVRPLEVDRCAASRRGLLALLGGSWHDFEGFAAWLRPNLECMGYAATVAFAVTDLTHLEQRTTDLLLLYNCYDEHSTVDYSQEQVASLEAWVQRGGRLLAMHAATVAARREPRLKRLLGGAFADHPPLGWLDVTCAQSEHSVLHGLGGFRLQDELYRHDVEPGIDVQLIASNGQETHPVAWTRRVGKGAVAYLALGHDARAWQQASFSRVVEQLLGWLRDLE